MPAPLQQSPFHAGTLDEIRAMALSRLDRQNADYLEGGSGSETTLRRNRSDFDRWAFDPRVMSGLSLPSTTAEIFGQHLDMPIFTAPFGSDGLFHYEGHLAVARANEAAGLCSIVPEASTFSFERVAQESQKAAKLAQFHPMGSADNVQAVIRRIEDSGYEALVVTVDCPTVGWRLRNLTNRYEVNPAAVGGNYPPGSAVEMEDVFGQLFPHYDAVWSWAQLSEVMAGTTLPWVAKGILNAADAEAALGAGAAGIIVSNHGGRQLHDVRSAVSVLPEIAAAVGDHGVVGFDSGVRCGADVVKALALGADFVLLGRLALYGLVAAGEHGLRRVYDLLKQEIVTTLALLGRGNITDIDRTAVVDMARVGI